MVYRLSWSRKTFIVFNYAFLAALSLLCIFPFVHILALSFSSSSAAAAGAVSLWPVDFTLASYENVLGKQEFLSSFVVSVKRVLLGTSFNMLLTVLAAYPLSKEAGQFRLRTAYVWFFVLTMLFSGGLIPLYMTVKTTGMMDSIWSLVIPAAVPVYNVVLLLNFFRGLPKELEESAMIDGANPFVILRRIYLPLSVPALATLTLFCVVSHWNSWFDGLIYMNDPSHYPLQSFLQTVVIQRDMRFLTPQDIDMLKLVSDRTNAAAQIFVATFPILIVYPFLQKYFVHGIVLGSVKE
ncbi:putative aldouronate transport system permease protein [Paenibacillus sp. UNC496MF]|uniref:carbohydrate ABC transporter permease n=1 Tax=Paenibacillus sp. UNC496MF TaxID=1502753 RepID=UPI0008E5F71B|nr:carbohydrate ABC transporter permease [Paenibacillus sp. UNC496MF]SFJ80373.1 putative aldouronate transport system permease protein [Paenibacillus sp. UNC496MF]